MVWRRRANGPAPASNRQHDRYANNLEHSRLAARPSETGTGAGIGWSALPTQLTQMTTIIMGPDFAAAAAAGEWLLVDLLAAGLPERARRKWCRAKAAAIILHLGPWPAPVCGRCSFACDSFGGRPAVRPVQAGERRAEVAFVAPARLALSAGRSLGRAQIRRLPIRVGGPIIIWPISSNR
jgi:hypothetical protein